WMHAQHDGPAPAKLYSDVEGGLGWWRDTRFPTTTPKFIMGGVAPNFSEIANGPAHGAGDWDHPRGLYGVAQLSPWLLFPLDSRPSEPNRALQMETQYVPAFQAADGKGQVYARIAPTSFPRGPGGESAVVHRVTSYDRRALWDAVQTWFDGGPPAGGAVDPAG